jgi:glycosyltransferase involved in cell wall biosynthesis
MSTPIVDVAIVTYNHEKFIGQAIESVLAQKDCSYRIIIGDDCSEDRTQEIVRQYAEQNPDRIEAILFTQHVGLGRKDRVGIKVFEACTAKYVALLDGDDFWTDPLKLHKQINFLEQHTDLAISFHNVECFVEGGDKKWLASPPDQKALTTMEDLLSGNFIHTCSAVFRRPQQKLPEWFYESTLGDWPLYVILAQHGKIGYLNEVMGSYRMHGRGFWSTQPSSVHLLDGIRMLDHLNDYLGPRYRKRIRSTQAKIWAILAETKFEAGEFMEAREHLKTAIRVDLSVGRLPPKGVIARSIQLRNPRLYKALKGFRSGKAPNRTI